MVRKTMAQKKWYGIELDWEQFSCSVCLDLLKEPISLCCGHSYCRSCIESSWDKEEEKGECSCPQCRETFHPRPVLRRNNMLAEVVKKLKRRDPQLPPPPLSGVDPADITCDFCGPRQSKATKTCRTCSASYCDEHVEPHYSVSVLQKHELVPATIPLVEKMCTYHKKTMELYCQTDKQLICTECIVGKHKGHKFVSASEKKDVTKKQLESVQKQTIKKVQQREEELENLLQTEEDLKDSAQTLLTDCNEIFANLISSLQRRCSEVEQLIKIREKTVVSQAEKLKVQLEEELNKLRRRDAELQDLLNAEDLVYLMQSHFVSDDSEDFFLCAAPPRSFRDVSVFVSQLNDKIDILLKETWPKISTTVSYIDFSLPPPPSSRREFLNYWKALTLDETSNYPYLHLTDENQRMRPSPFQNAAHPNRFTKFPQVLCREALTHRCYWEVEWHARVLSAAVVYKTVNRTSDESQFGKNDKSWTLECSENAILFCHNNVERKVLGSCSKRIGIFLDFQAGILSFYHVSDPMVQIFEVRTTFTEPLYPGLGLTYEWHDIGVFAQLTTL